MDFIKPCKHIPIFKANTYDESLRVRGQVPMLLELLLFVILNNGFCICIFFL